MHMDFDIKKIITQFVPKDIGKLHELIRAFENNESFNKKGLF